MKLSITKVVCCGLVSLIAAAVGGGAVMGQCCGNNSSGEIVYEGAPIAQELSSEDLLREVDDPTKIINLTVIVNEAAVVKINGEETETKGTLRPYIVRGLTPGKKYKFEIEGLVKTKTGAEYFANSVQVGTINAITDEAVKPEYFTSDQEKIYALSYEERNAGNGQGFNLLSAIERNSADKNDHTIDLTAYLKTLKSKQNVVIPGGNYVLNETWRVNPEEVFSIAAGTQIIINSGISIYVSGVLNFEGKPELPVILKNSVEGEPWGCLAYHKTQMNSHLNNVIIRFAGMAKIDSVNFTGGVSAYDATIFLNSCTFENIRADDGINVKNSETRLVNCRFVQAKDDAIDFDFSNGEIRDCYFYKSGGDAIDCGTASPKIIGNLFEYPGDKCISLGEASSPVIENNLLFGGSYGIAIKDNSNPVIKNNTICANDKGIALYIKKPKEFGCPTATIERCIIWDNKVEIENLCEAKFIIKNSAVKGGYSGEKIYSTPPEFSSGSGSLTSRYVLKENSTYALKGLGATKGSWQ